MTEKKLYTCDICHTDYADSEKAAMCEKEHCLYIGAKDFRYRANQKYPDRILVKFEDGSQHWYKR